MINKDNLKGKYVTYLDKNGQYRSHKVVKIAGLTLTVQNVLGERHRIHPKKNKIFGRQKKKELEEIDWTT
jgi:hypothetical protein